MDRHHPRRHHHHEQQHYHDNNYRPHEQRNALDNGLLQREQVKRYDPIMAGSIDGTDTVPHDHAIIRALRADYEASKDPKIKSKPHKTLFVGRLSYDTTEETLRTYFEAFGRLRSLRLVRDIVTGKSKGYAFVEYEHQRDFEEALQRSGVVWLDGVKAFTDSERERLMEGWVPRRLGGGFGGKKESGQLRFGGRDRPWRKPISLRSFGGGGRGRGDGGGSYVPPQLRSRESRSSTSPSLQVKTETDREGSRERGEREERRERERTDGKDRSRDSGHKDRDRDSERKREREREKDRDRKRDKERHRERDKEREDRKRKRERSSRGSTHTEGDDDKRSHRSHRNERNKDNDRKRVKGE
ncbi:small nuclear ribonucleoprotein 35kDa (U11 U12) [Balamuthia mandrillaris]